MDTVRTTGFIAWLNRMTARRWFHFAGCTGAFRMSREKDSARRGMRAISPASLSPHGPPVQPFPSLMAPLRRFEWLLFFACFVAFAWFHQGGGWNQNSRFAEVRAIVEEGRFAIDDFLVYKIDPADPGGNELVRLPLDHAEYDWQGERRLLAWVDMVYTLFPVTDTPSTPDVVSVPMIEECNSGDIGYVKRTGHFHPN